MEEERNRKREKRCNREKKSSNECNKNSINRSMKKGSKVNVGAITEGIGRRGAARG